MVGKEYVSSDALCIREIIEGREVWDITIDRGQMRTLYAAYTSKQNYRLLKEKYFEHFKEMDPSLTRLPSFNRNYADDFAEDLREKTKEDLGGIVVFFIESRDDYYLRHTSPVTRIGEVG